MNELTERQEQVMRMVARGYTEREIARDLGTTSSTISQHYQNIRERLGARNMPHAVLLWIEAKARRIQEAS